MRKRQRGGDREGETERKRHRVKDIELKTVRDIELETVRKRQR